MATWRGHIGGALVFFAVPAGAAAALGGTEWVTRPPLALAQKVQSSLALAGLGLGGAQPDSASATLAVGGWRLLWSAVLVCMAVVFGLFADTDTRSVGRRLTWSLTGFSVLLLASQAGQVALPILAALLGFAALLVGVVTVASMAKHRTWTHTHWAAAGVPVLLAGLPMWYLTTDFRAGLLVAVAGALGYFSHLAMDGLLFKGASTKRFT